MARRKKVAHPPLVRGDRELAVFYLERGRFCLHYETRDVSPADKERIAAYVAEHMDLCHDHAYADLWLNGKHE